ncbi:MAG: dienelactone hydrolase family protein [Chloroflexota bacterium]
MSTLTNIYRAIQQSLQRSEPEVWTPDVVGKRQHVREIHLASISPDVKPPLIIGLHGYGINEMQMKTLVNVQLNQPFIYLAPRAPYIHPTGGYAWFPVDSISNGDKGREFHVDPASVQSSLQLIAELIPLAVERYQADPNRVFIIGYSQGAAMSIAFMLSHPELLAGGAAMSGQLLDEAKSLASKARNGNPARESKPFFLGYGTKDPFITQSDMLNTIAFMESGGVNVTYHEYPIPHVVSQQQLRDLERWILPYC